MAKITSKKTIMFFLSKEKQKEAEDFLLKLNVNFRAALVNNWVEVAPTVYKKQCLDLYLPEHLGISTFNFKFN